MPQKSGPNKSGPNKSGLQRAKLGRYTPPTPKTVKRSPFWVPVVMGAALLSGLVVLLGNYLNMLPGDAQNRYLLLGLTLVTSGFVMASTYH
jgi:hypothetical protein